MHFNIIGLISVASAIAVSAIPTTYFSVEAELINKKGTPIYDEDYHEVKWSKIFGPDWKTRGIGQLGRGLYLSNLPMVTQEPNIWFCFILANAEKLAKVPKVFIPETMYNGGEKAFENLIGDKWKSTLRMDEKKGPNVPEGFTQMLIPPAMVHNDDLGMKATCYSSVAELPVSKKIPWDFDNLRKLSE
ncbi:Uu.00g145660.m01.CDS01 [Anthostomella pinea]|uniref:Uu.00g145660.m01.CDS01 n=1 Tax=Anthostomella pinea TaxID=933095 RepID=A0AAI8VR45_9PEZI|nr:Uu.00g145660.m01.CDS01 [Anthostomella pinea]